MSPTLLLGITGGIAAYKTPLLVRLLVQAGMEVRPVMTKAATAFVTPLTLATVSGSQVFLDMWSDPRTPSMEHISLADQADAAIIAPATANFIGKAAAGVADDLLTTLFLVLRCPVLICPSMNVNMYANAVVQQNIERLRSLGYHIMEPDAGFLACGWEGSGRMPEPEAIARRVLALVRPHDLEGLRVLVTAGPTEEPLDPVRFLTNKSSGKMGVAVARRAAARGASVTLVAGPLKTPPPREARHIPVRTAREMSDAVLRCFPETDVVIKAAAVADFRPASEQAGKMKKDEMGLSISLVKNPDILKMLGQQKRQDQILVGFAAETHSALHHARKKLKEKNADMLVLNDVSKPGAGFDTDTNIVTFLFRNGQEEEMDMMSKDDVADAILDRILRLRQPSAGKDAPS
jgi:phosphopantothenoylcysteine decarboxylase / phosphopantothenate---cysteine ligase